MFTDWELNQANRIAFVMVDSSNVEVPGLGSGFTLQLSKNGGAFAASGGTKAEIGNGWYTYLATAGEADTVGPVAVKVTGAGAVQQNLEYVVKQRNPGAIEYTYTVTNTVTALPIEGVRVVISTDSLGSNVVFVGMTDSFGVLRDSYSNKPRLDAGTYFLWSSKIGFSFPNPDSEVIS